MESFLPPSGGDVNLGPRINALNWTLCGFALLIVCARLYTRVRIVRDTGWDDWIMVLAMVLAIVTSFINSLEVHYGLGRHINYLSPYQIMMAAKIDDLSQPFSTFSSCFARISVALLLRRIINPSKPQRYLLWFVIISLLIITFVQNVIQFVRCKPVGKLWNPEIPGTCWNGDVSSKMGYVQAAWSVWTDFTLALLPSFVFSKLQMKLRMKVGLIALMSLGSLVGVAAIIKTLKIRGVSSSPDFTWNVVQLVYWYTIENYGIIVAACIPTVKPLFTRTVKYFKTSHSASDEFAKRLRPSRRSYHIHDEPGSNTELPIVPTKVHTLNAPSSMSALPVGTETWEI